MDVALHRGGLNVDAQPLPKELVKSVDKVPEAGVAFVDQGVVAIDYFRLLFFEWCRVRIVLPKLRARGFRVENKLLRKTL